MLEEEEEEEEEDEAVLVVVISGIIKEPFTLSHAVAKAERSDVDQVWSLAVVVKSFGRSCAIASSEAANLRSSVGGGVHGKVSANEWKKDGREREIYIEREREREGEKEKRQGGRERENLRETK